VGSVEREIYEEGVRFACWGMAMYSLSCSCYSFIIERLVKRFKYECKTRKIENFRVQSSNNENFLSYFHFAETGRDKFTWAVN
jgi:hypothetical protein